MCFIRFLDFICINNNNQERNILQWLQHENMISWMLLFINEKPIKSDSFKETKTMVSSIRTLLATFVT